VSHYKFLDDKDSILVKEVYVDYSTLDDSTLIRLVAHTKAEALSELYDRYSRLVFSLALAVIKDHALAEEITQDVFLRVWENAKTYKADQAKVSVWLTRITRNRAIDVLRQRSAHPEEHTADWAKVIPSEMHNTNTPQKAVELTSQKERIRAAIAQLPEDQKQALQLAYFQGYTHQEIAKLLNTPLGTVKTRIRLAMLKLRDVLQEE
jgi:RNA polymerase sigma-70 factor (ECF subfamily)